MPPTNRNTVLWLHLGVFPRQGGGGGGNTFYHKKGNALVQRQAMHTTVSWLYQGYSSEILLSLTLLQMACSWKEYKSDFGRFGRLNKSDFWEVWMVKTFGDPRVTEHRSHD